MNESVPILDSLNFHKDTFTDASKGKRLANYLIDGFGYLCFAFVVGLFLGYATLDTGYEETIFSEEPTAASKIIDYIFGIIVILTYYTTQEYFLKGKSIGKFITKTRAVTIHNEQLSFSNALGRSACRIIPFEAFSFLGEKNNGWHDSISKTKVIDDIGWENEIV